MSSFNIFRLCIYFTVIVFSLICLSLSANFQHVLATSNLTRFVPFALFVSVIGLFIIVSLLAFSAIKGTRNPISTRMELGGVGLAGLFWLILAIFMLTAGSQDADVECFASSADTSPIAAEDASLQTDAFHAMYRVLMAFSFLNAFILLVFSGFMLVLAYRRFSSGDEQMLYNPITSFAWFSSNYSKNKGLPGPGGRQDDAYTSDKKRSKNKRSTQDRGRLPPGAEFFGRPRRDPYARSASPRPNLKVAERFARA